MSTAYRQSAGFSLIMALQFLFRVFPGQAATPVCLSSTLCSEPGHPAAYELELSSRSRIPREQMGHTLSASTGITLPPAGCRQTGVLSFDPLVTPTHCCILFVGRYKFNRYPHRRSHGALTWLERVVQPDSLLFNFQGAGGDMPMLGNLPPHYQFGHTTQKTKQ